MTGGPRGEFELLEKGAGIRSNERKGRGQSKLEILVHHTDSLKGASACSDTVREAMVYAML